jgi:hypothetical protein
MGALFGLFTIIVLSITVVRIGAMAFELTGLSEEVAAFQAQSAFSGVGFTTAESESIVSHPLRRKIARLLILLGSAGFTSTIATFILTFIGQTGKGVFLRIVILSAGVAVIFLLSRSEWVYRAMRKIIKWGLEKFTSLKICDYQEVLGLKKGYTISRIFVKENNWMAGQALNELHLSDEGILILSIHRVVDGEDRFIGIPTKDTVIGKDDILICYGRSEALINLSQRPKGHSGDDAHLKSSAKEREAAAKRDQSGGYS